MSDFWIPSRPEYFVQTGGMHENPFGVPKDEIIRMILENPAEVSAQVIFGKYVESSGLVFTAELVQSMINRKWERLNGNFWYDKEAVEYARTLKNSYELHGSPFHSGIDVARKTDYTVISVLDTRVMPAPLVYYKRLNRVPWESIYREIGKVRALFGPNLLVDSTGPGGDVVMDALDSRLFCAVHGETVLVGSRCIRDGQTRGCDPSKYLSLSCCEGFHFSASTKVQLIEHLRNVMSVGYNSDQPELPFGWLRVPPIVQLEEEMSFYTWDDKKLDTDCVMSLALAAWSGLEDPLEDGIAESIYGT